MHSAQFMSERRDVQAEELERPLGPEYVSFKNGHAYIEGHKVVRLANEVFGFDGWSSEIRNMTIDYTDEKGGRFTIGASCTMRITLKSGVFREDIGYGSSINMPHRFQAYDKARKEATTDALKRALRQFGESLGNCLYNREYVEMVKRLKPEKTTFDSEDLRRPRKKIKTELRSVANPPQHIFDDDADDDDDEFGDLVPAHSKPGAQPEPKRAAASGAGVPGPEAVTRTAPEPARTEPVKIEPARTEPGYEVGRGAELAEPGVAADDDAVFVTADHVDLVQSPANQSTPLPPDALFDTSRSTLRHSTVPQDRSMRIPRRPKT